MTPLRRLSTASLTRAVGLGAVLVAVLAAGCDSGGTGELAPYEGQRPLQVLRVTQSFTPEIQWVGGRVAAVGVNRGTRAALDSTLVWLQTAPNDSISSFATVGLASDSAAVARAGGTFQRRLADGQVYTVWLAERAAFDAGLDSARIAPGSFADTTLTTQLLLRGRSGGGAGVAFQVERDERLTSDRFVVSWSPASVVFRQVAIRKASTGGFMDLVWQVLDPDGTPASVTSPVTIGVPPAGTTEAVAFPESGFEPSVYTLWANTDAWTGSFSPSAPGYAFFQMFASNFQAP